MKEILENFIEKVKNILKDKVKRKKIVIGIAVISVIYLMLSYFGINYTMSKIHTNLKVDKVRKRPVNLEKKEAFSILLLGVDTDRKSTR